MSGDVPPVAYENGEVKANRGYASGSSTVTIPATQEDGYMLDELTVTDSRAAASK